MPTTTHVYHNNDDDRNTRSRLMADLTRHLADWEDTHASADDVQSAINRDRDVMDDGERKEMEIVRDVLRVVAAQKWDDVKITQIRLAAAGLNRWAAGLVDPARQFAIHGGWMAAQEACVMNMNGGVK